MRNYLKNFFKDFIYLCDRETASERGNTSRGSGRGRSRLVGSIPEPWDHSLSWRQMLNDCTTQVPLIFFSLKILFIYLIERDSQQEREYKHGEWERKRQAPSGGARCGAPSQNAGIMPWAERRCSTAVPPRRPSPRILMDSCLTSRSFIHLEFIFVYGVREWSSLIILHVAVKFSSTIY